MSAPGHVDPATASKTSDPAIEMTLDGVLQNALRAARLLKRATWNRLADRLRATAPAVVPETPPVDSDFDWQWYLESYPDVRQAGVETEQSAWFHFVHFGRAEGRRCRARQIPGFDWLSHVDRFEHDAANPDAFLGGGPAAGELRRPPKLGLLCPSADSLFLRAWGDLVCWDDAGAEHVLQPWQPEADVGDVFLRGPFEEIRESLWQGELPRPDECGKCLLLRTRAVTSSAPADLRFVRMVRVEPTYRCTLDCPGCVPLEIRRQHRESFDLEPEKLAKVLDDLATAGLEVHAVDFQGHGEPLLNPRLPEMIALSRRRFPGAWVSVTTNAHGKVKPALLEARPSEVICAIDGATPESYARYRVHGRFALAQSFLRELARRADEQNPHIRVVWKYVLFAHNSSPEELLLAQRMARDAGVAELVFVFTRNGAPPEHLHHPDDIPRLDDGPRLGFRYHEPSIDDFEHRLAELRSHLERGGVELAISLAASLVSGVERFFSASQPLPDRYRDVLSQTGAALERAGAGRRLRPKIEQLLRRSPLAVLPAAGGCSGCGAK